MIDINKVEKIKKELIKEILNIEKVVASSVIKETNTKIVETIVKKFEEVLYRYENQED